VNFNTTLLFLFLSELQLFGTVGLPCGFVKTIVEVISDIGTRSTPGFLFQFHDIDVHDGLLLGYHRHQAHGTTGTHTSDQNTRRTEIRLAFTHHLRIDVCSSGA
jgi:hypothetical protein